MEGKRRIAFVLGGMSFGGAERVISILANHYVRKGWSVDILTLLKPDCDYALNPEIRHIHMGGRVKSRAMRAPIWFWQLKRYLSKEKPNVIVSFAARINLLVLGASLFIKKPRLIISERNDPMKDSRTSIVRKLTSLLYPLADVIVFQTEHAKQCFPENVQKKGRIIINPVTPNLPVANMTSKRIVAVGKLMQQKNHAMLIRAFSHIAEKFPEHTLHIYGDGPMRPQLQAMIDERGLTDRAVLEGWDADISNTIADAALFVLSSDYEGMSNALMEAIAMGLPCISTDCAGAQELIENGKEGLIIPIGDEEALIVAMKRMLEDRDFAAACGRSARQHAKAFDTVAILKKWEEAIEGC